MQESNMNYIWTFNTFAEYLERHLTYKTDRAIYISTFGWREWPGLQKAFMRSVRPVRIFSNFDGFIRRIFRLPNVTFRNTPTNHAKLILDGPEIYIGSQNISMTDDWFNFGVVVKDTACASRLRRRLNSLPHTPLPDYETWIALAQQEKPSSNS